MQNVSELPEVNLSYKKHGANIYLNIEGKEEDIDRYFIFLVNYGGCPSCKEDEDIYNKLIWNSSTKAYLQLTPKALLSAYQAYWFVYLVINNSLSDKDAEKESLQRAKKSILSISEEDRISFR